jgi:hypothetical protein
MNFDEIRLYCDTITQFHIEKNSTSSVILIGGSLGYPNFGDILQLKGAIKWHKEKTLLEPIVVFQLQSIRDCQFLEQVRQWFNVTAVLFFSQGKIDPRDVEGLGLAPIAAGFQIPYLHLYGGGFLNNWWGQNILALVELMHALFGVAHYVVSGQQIAPAFANSLSKHFKRYPPLIVGARDHLSLEILQSLGVPAEYSFDDAFEPLSDLVSLKDNFYFKSNQILIHLNASSYTKYEKDEGDLKSILINTELYLDIIRKNIGKNLEETEVVLLHAYHHSNPHYINDTLKITWLLEERFPFFKYSVVDLAKVALELWSAEPNLPKVSVSPNALAISSSYHVTVFCGLLKIPCFLHEFNSYYSQKKQGLGLTAENIKNFFESPEKIRTENWVNLRRLWQEKLLTTYQKNAIKAKNLQKIPNTGAWSDNAPMQRFVSSREDHIQIKLEQTQSQLKEEGLKVERLWEELCHYKEELARSQSQLKEEGLKVEQLWEELCHYKEELARSQSQLKEEGLKVEQLWEELCHYKEELARSQSQLQPTQKELERAHIVISAMQSSKFWKLRTSWLKLKKIFGLAKKY